MKKTARELRDKGIAQSLKSANELHPNWSENAYNFLKKFIRKNKKFLCEDVRYHSIGTVPPTRSARSWGAIIRRAASEGLIRRVGIDEVKNAKAHACYASVWAVN
jgi:hypothetical protein